MSATPISAAAVAGAVPHLVAALDLAVPAMLSQLEALRELGADDEAVAAEIEQLEAAIAAARRAVDVVPIPIAGIVPLPLPELQGVKAHG